MSSASSSQPAPSGPHDGGNGKVPWNPWVALFWVVGVFFAAQYFSSYLISLYPYWHHWSHAEAVAWLNGSVIAQFLYILVAETFIIGSIYLFLRYYKVGFLSIGLKKPRWRDLLYGLAAIPVYFVLYIVTVSLVLHFIPSFDVNQRQQIGFSNVHGAAALILTFISLAVLPPLAEEIMVRGFLYGTFKKILPTAAAVIATSLVFASAHLSEGGATGPLYIAALDTFVLSLVLIYLREKTGSLWASITLHAAKNGYAFFIIFIAPMLHVFKMWL